MKNFFILTCLTVWDLIVAFVVISQYKIRLILWNDTTKALLFNSFLKDEVSQVFIQIYFPVLYEEFIYLQKFSLTLKENGF